MRLIPDLDTSLLVPLVAADALADGAEAWLRPPQDRGCVREFARRDAAAAHARKRRMGVLTLSDAASATGRFDEWRKAVGRPAALALADLALADLDLAHRQTARFDLPLRAPDAFRPALAHRPGATFDAGMATAAQALALPVAVA